MKLVIPAEHRCAICKKKRAVYHVKEGNGFARRCENCITSEEKEAMGKGANT